PPLLAPATPPFYTLSLHDALPISLRILRVAGARQLHSRSRLEIALAVFAIAHSGAGPTVGEDSVHFVAGDDLFGDLGHELEVVRSEEHTSELQSLAYLVCRLLLEK